MSLHASAQPQKQGARCGTRSGVTAASERCRRCKKVDEAHASHKLVVCAFEAYTHVSWSCCDVRMLMLGCTEQAAGGYCFGPTLTSGQATTRRQLTKSRAETPSHYRVTHKQSGEFCSPSHGKKGPLRSSGASRVGGGAASGAASAQARRRAPCALFHMQAGAAPCLAACPCANRMHAERESSSSECAPEGRHTSSVCY